MNFVPHAVQKAALKASAGRPGFGYFMEQGLGKTMTSYMDFMERVAEGRASRKLVVCPNSFKGGWVAEAEKYDVQVDPFIFDSGNDYKNNAFLRKRYEKAPVLVVNYEAIRSEQTRAYIYKFLSEGRGSFATWDESIQLKGHDSAQTKGVIEIAKEVDFARALSGKPMSQGPHDLWGQMRAIKQLNGRNFYSFKTAFCKMGGFKMKQVVGAQNEDLLSQLIEPHVFRALKADWTDLPPKIYTHRSYELGGEMKRMYKQMEEEFVLMLENDQFVSVDAAITKYIKLAQIQAGFILDENGKAIELIDPKHNPRVNLLTDILESEVVGKVTIPYHHRYTREILVKALAKYNPANIRGQMDPSDIEAEKRRFNEDSNCRVILLQTRASKYGHTLLGDQRQPETACSTCIFFENTYSLDDRSQIEDRNHRHGQQQESVLYIDLVGTPLDRNATAALQRKENVYQTVFKNIRSVRA